jgi:hypothetical protein
MISYEEPLNHEIRYYESKKEEYGVRILTLSSLGLHPQFNWTLYNQFKCKVPSLPRFPSLQLSAYDETPGPVLELIIPAAALSAHLELHCCTNRYALSRAIRASYVDGKVEGRDTHVHSCHTRLWVIQLGTIALYSFP